MKIPIYIPSKNRANKILKEEPWILDYPNDVCIVVSPDNQEEYDTVLRNVKVHVLVCKYEGNMSLIRNFILENAEHNFGKNTWIAMLDDDVKRLEFYENGKWTEYNTGKQIHEVLNLLLEKYGDAELIGSNGVNNRFFKTLKPNNQGFICADGFLLKIGDIKYDENLKVKEDYYMVCNFLKNKKKIYSLGNFNVMSKHYTKGGIATWDIKRSELDKEAQSYLLKLFPEFLKPKRRKNSEYELSFIRRKSTNINQQTLFDF